MSRDRIVGQLRRAAKGDRTALELALAEMRTLAFSPRYWDRYLLLLGNPLARLVDLTVIKQGDRIAHQKGWKIPKSPPPAPAKARKPKRTRPRRASPTQPSLFDLA